MLLRGRNDVLVVPSILIHFVHVLYVSPATLTVIMDRLVSILTSLL
jgi:hypothetical protein